MVEGTPTDLKREISGEVVKVGLDGGDPRAPALLRGEPYVRGIEPTADGVRLYVDDGATAMPRIMRTLDGSGIALRSIELHRPSLDDVFLARTGRSLRDDA